MDYLTFHIREEATEEIKAFLRELGGAGKQAPAYTFAPDESGCDLKVGTEGRAALQLTLGHCIHVEEDPIEPEEATRWRTPQYHGARPPADTGIDVKEIAFWIDGAAMARLLETGWTAARVGDYDYGFRPHGDGITLWVGERGGNEAVELSAGLD